MRCGQPTLVVYDCERLPEVLAANTSLNCEEAEEFIQYNCVYAWDGPNTPVFLYRAPFEAGEHGAEEREA